MAMGPMMMTSMKIKNTPFLEVPLPESSQVSESVSGFSKSVSGFGFPIFEPDPNLRVGFVSIVKYERRSRVSGLVSG